MNSCTKIAFSFNKKKCIDKWMEYDIWNKIYKQINGEEKAFETTLNKMYDEETNYGLLHTKETFSFNSKTYKHMDRVSIQSPLEPALANIIMTELETSIVKDFFRQKSMHATCWCLVKEKDITLIHKRSNSFDKNVKFTIDKFLDDMYFLNMQIDKNHTNICYKPRHTGQYTHFHNQTPWLMQTSWIKSFFYRVEGICSTEATFREQVKNIKKLGGKIEKLFDKKFNSKVKQVF